MWLRILLIGLMGRCSAATCFVLMCLCSLGDPKIALRRGGGMAWAPGEGRGGLVPEMGFRAGPFVLCKDGCCHQRRQNKQILARRIFFHEKNFPHICVVKMISATWGSF